MKRIDIVGFSGPMGCGKSTAIEALKEATDRPVVLVKFAQALYDIQEMIYQRISPVYQRPSDFVKDRKLLQWVGTEWGRGLNENLWVELWMKAVAKTSHENPRALIVCDDVRFDNEAELLTKIGGAIIRIETSRNHERIDTKAGIANHASEAGISLQYVTRRIDNDGSLVQYKSKLKEIFSELTVN